MKRLLWPVILLGAMLLASSGCFLTDLVSRVVSPGDSEALIKVELPTPNRPTLYPTRTLQPTLAPTRTAAPAAATHDPRFQLELTEDDISAMVEEQGLSAQGMDISDVTTTITPEHVIATVDASHADSGLSGKITFIAVPRVVGGQLYLEIVDFSLGSSFTGFARLIASALIQSVLDSYNTGDGIPIPITGIEAITDVELFDGKLVVTGTFR